MDLKECDEYQAVESIKFCARRFDDELKEKYAEFLKNKLSSDGITNYTFEFINDNIRKKLELTMKEDPEDDTYLPCCVSNLMVTKDS
ncbi:hypothetical protein Ddc_14593 [Ditylenchus destructor]|nr:hypothetical protein Ddc_14593 [Ditylenchus destructor]